MTIDEAISFCDEKTKNIKLKAEPQTFIDIKEMLEELKCYRNENNFSEYADRLYKKVYNKALDDFMEKIDDDICCDCSKCGNGCRLLELREIAKQLRK